MSRGARAEPAPPECALAAEMFDHLCAAGTMKQTLALHREICAALNLRPNKLPDFYPKLKAKLAGSWKAQALFKKFDARANHKVYAKGRACASTRVLIIGAGPCGMRAAIECQLLGAKVVVIEKRDRMSRNNVLHLWPFVIQDLRALGAKKFFGKFCAGSIDHISIRQLQCILLKVALFLGVEFHEGVSFEELLEPTVTENNETLGWRARVLPADHPVSHYEFDALLGADGRRNTLPGFKRKEFRGKLAMAITANFINRHSEQEASVPEISGVAFIFNQKFFKDLYEETGIDLENIVYYKDDTHYFVMTAKKHSLLDKGVLLNDYNEVSRLLNVDNVDRAALMRYAQEAARFSTDGRLPLRDFALNHYGEPDVALFDFTSMYAAENASMVYERLGRRLLCQLVGDSLLEPFWPTGSGCARGFLSALDAAWAVRAWGQAPPPHPLHVVAERESVYRLLAQTTPENLNRDFGGYTLDPGTRYPNLNRAAVNPHRVTGFYDSDEPLPLDAGARKRRREAEVSEEVLVSWLGVQAGGLRDAAAAPALAALLRRYRPDLLTDAPDSVYAVLQHEFGIPALSSGSLREVPDAKLRAYLARVYSAFKGEVPHVHHETDVFLQIKQNQQKEKLARNTTDHSLAMYANAVDADKSHSSCRKKRRAVRTPQVSTEDEYIRRKIGKLDLNDITHLARLIEGHDDVASDQSGKQQALQEQILALLDPDDSPDPQMLRESLAQLLQGTSTPKPTQQHKVRAKRAVAADEQTVPNLDSFFNNMEPKPVRPPRRLKGLDLTSIKYPDLSDLLDDEYNETDATVLRFKAPSVSKKEFTRSNSTDSPSLLKERRPSEIIDAQKRRSHSPSPKLPYGRSNSIGAPECATNTRRIADMFESQKRRHTPSPESVRSGSASTTERALRWQRMTDLIEGKSAPFVNPDRVKLESIGNPEMAFRRQRVAELIKGHKLLHGPSPETPRRKNTEDMSFRMQRASDQVQKNKSTESKKRSGGRRKAAREIMKQRFEKSLQMLAAEPQMALSSSADLEHDVGLQQYRANAPHFDERVKKLEKQLQHYEEGRVITGGSRSGGGARVARLAAELSGTARPTTPRASGKPKDLMRSVGKIERDDWNVKEIEKKIMQNRLGRPEPRTAEKVPKWDREQFLGRQRRLKEGENEEKWGVIDETLHKLDQKLRDSGRPDHGTKKVANLANKFVKRELEPEKTTEVPKEDKKSWRGPSTAGMQCAACGTRVFAAESVTADGLHLHRSCFRCAVCKAVLRPGNYTMERYGSRLVCLRHSGVSVPDAAAAALAALAGGVAAPTPERISLEASDSGAREIDEDEWTDRNFLASETSGAGGLSDEEDTSSEAFTDAEDSAGEPDAEPAAACERPRSHLYLSDDSFGYDDYSDDGGESSGNESCSRMREAREARRREVPADARPPTDSSEVESEDESEESEESEPSSGTEVSTDSEFAREEPAAPPAILVTEAPPPLPPPPPPPPVPLPLARTRSAGGLATKRALELKRKYLLGEPSPPAVRKSDSTSQLDTKLQAFRTNITEFQKMLHPAPSPPTPPVVSAFQVTTDAAKKPMPDIIKNLCEDAPVDLLKLDCKRDWREEPITEEKTPEHETDSISEESSHTETGPEQPVPRVEVHDEGGELIQMDSLMIIPESEDTQPPPEETAAVVESESSESCRDATTLALTETELSDWAAESAVMDDFDEHKEDRKRAKNPRTLSGPKTVHDAKNLSTISSHVCGRSSPTQFVQYSNALEHFEFADEGEQDPTIGSPMTLKNEGYMELVDEDYNVYSPVNDRSMNFIERSYSDTFYKQTQDAEPSSITPVPSADIKSLHFDEMTRSTDSESTVTRLERPIVPELKSPQLLVTIESSESEQSISKPTSPVADKCATASTIGSPITTISSTRGTFSSLKSPSSSSRSITSTSTDTKEPSSLNSPSLIKELDTIGKADREMTIIIHKDSSSEISPPLADTPLRNTFAASVPFTMYSPAICRSASAQFPRPLSPDATTTNKVQELKREREEQTDIVRKLVLERLGQAPRRSARRCRASPASGVPPPVPPPPELPPPPEAPPPRPALPLPVMPSLSDPELARDRRSKSIIRSLSSYFNRRLGPRTKWVSEPDLTPHEGSCAPARLSKGAHKSTGALELPPPVPPPPARYRPPDETPPPTTPGSANDTDERDAMQLWFEARWARLVAARRARDEAPRSEPAARRLARLERRLARPLSAEQQAAAVAELVQVSAQRGAHQALLMNAADNRRRSTASGSCE